MKSSHRWPPLFGLVLTAALVFLVLPNPLRIPQNNPAAQAEYAPVPGDQEDATNANFGETGQAGSGGIGSGSLSEELPPIQPLPPEPVFKPGDKKCFSDAEGSSRQTEDPLSPPCVPFYFGDNGGATYQGVTGDEILVVLYNDMDIKGDMNQPWVASQEQTGHETSQNGQQTYLVRTVKALFSYFAQRYQTYGRRVHMIAVPSGGGITSTCPQRQIEATVIQRDYKPFAVVHFGDNGQCFLNEMGKFDVPGFGLNADVPRAEFEQQDSKGLVWGFFPDQEAMAAWSASFICRKLHGGVARFAPEVRLQSMQRKFGLVYPNAAEDQRGPSSAQLAGLLVDELKKCGIRPSEDGSTDLIVKEFKGDGKTYANSIMTEFRLEDVTTVICYCVPVLTEVTVTHMQNAATSLNYFPEWYWDHTSRMFRAVWNERYQQDQHVSFGTSYHWRNRSFEEQHWYQAFVQMQPGAVPNTRFGFDIYHLFLNLFQGLQGAGPNLTPDNVQKGMFTFAYQQREDPYRPIGGYGSQHNPKWAVSPYTFIDTAMAFWWDPQGTPPGETDPNGCLRAVRNGYRYHAGEWPKGDDDLFLKSSPCYQDDTRISEAGTIGF